MPRYSLPILFALLAILFATALSSGIQPTTNSAGKIPLAFTKNAGQWDDRVLFRTSSNGATIWITNEGITYQYLRRVATQTDLASGHSPDPSSGHSREGGNPASGWVAGQNRFGFDASEPRSDAHDSLEQLVITAKFVGCNPNPEVIPDGQMEYKCNYFLGNDPTKWHTDVPNYESITLKNLYPGIDLRLSSDMNNQATYEFITAPAANEDAIPLSNVAESVSSAAIPISNTANSVSPDTIPLSRGVRGVSFDQVKITYSGIESTSLTTDGNLILQTKWGDMLAAFDPASTTGLASPQFVASQSKVPNLSESGESLSATKSGTLELAYSTRLGGSSYWYDDAHGLAIDDSGNAYIGGRTYSYDFPVLEPYQPTNHGSYDVFVTKLSSSGAMIYSTFIGGGQAEYGNAIAVGGNGDAYVAGETSSSDFPLLNPYQTYQGHGLTNAFVTKLNGRGDRLEYSTYLGGIGDDCASGVAVDANGGAYVAGSTTSQDFPTLNPFQGTLHGYDAFVSKLSSDGSQLTYSTLFGGSDDDWAVGIAIDANGCAYVIGGTHSDDLPLLNPFQTHRNGDYDVFVTKFTSDGSTLLYSTYLGGADLDDVNGIEVDETGCVYVAGRTFSSDFPLMNPYQSSFLGGAWGTGGSSDAFVTKLGNSGSSLLYSTYLGGTGEDWAVDVAADVTGSAHVTGWTKSSDFPALDPYQMTFQGGSSDVFVTKLDSSGSRLDYSTYIGGSGSDCSMGIAIDGTENVIVVGSTGSPNYPLFNPVQWTCQGRTDAFVTKLTWTPEYACGDVNTDEAVDLLDAVFLINYIFVGGPAPAQLALADLDCSGEINIADIVRIVSYIFWDGPTPCSDCN